MFTITTWLTNNLSIGREHTLILQPITPLSPHEFILLLSQAGEWQCVAITTYFTLQMITAAEVAVWEERNEITFPTPNGLSAKNKRDFMSLHHLRERDGMRETETWKKNERHNEGEKNEEMRAGPDTQMRQKWDAIVQWCGVGVVQDWWAALIGRGRCWIHTHTHTHGDEEG